MKIIKEKVFVDELNEQCRKIIVKSNEHAMKNQPAREEPQFLNIHWKVGVQGWKDGVEAAIITGTPQESVGTQGVILNVPGLYRNIF